MWLCCFFFFFCFYDTVKLCPECNDSWCVSVAWMVPLPCDFNFKLNQLEGGQVTSQGVAEPSVPQVCWQSYIWGIGSGCVFWKGLLPFWWPSSFWKVLLLWWLNCLTQINSLCICFPLSFFNRLLFFLTVCYLFWLALSPLKKRFESQGLLGKMKIK